LRRSVLLQKDLQLRFHRLPNDPLCALAYKVAELVVKGWIDERNNRIVGHGWRVSYLLKEGPGKPNFSRMRRLPQFSSYTRSDRSSNVDSWRLTFAISGKGKLALRLRKQKA